MRPGSQVDDLLSITFHIKQFQLAPLQRPANGRKCQAQGSRGKNPLKARRGAGTTFPQRLSVRECRRPGRTMPVGARIFLPPASDQASAESRAPLRDTSESHAANLIWHDVTRPSNRLGLCRTATKHSGRSRSRWGLAIDREHRSALCLRFGGILIVAP
jgi:hypothetical protein